MSTNERTNWRDQEISRRHRTWGLNCPAVDLDFLMVEYNLGKPVAIVEYKKYTAALPNLLHPTYRALNELADAIDIPFFIAIYDPSCWAFQIIKVNERSKDIFNYISDETTFITERQYVETLYEIRNRAIEKHVFKKLNDNRPIYIEPVT